jgi:uroporphyrinogen III methyltransferase / synthase
MLSKPLLGKSILITRDASQAGGLKQKLEEQGAGVISIPTISIEDPPDWSPFDEAAARLKHFDWVVFGSVNAVLQTSSRMKTLGVELPSSVLPKIAAVGDQTAICLRDQGWQVELVPDRFQAEDLGECLIADGVKGKSIWLPRALVARSVLIDHLSRAGAEIVMTPVYQNAVPMDNRGKLRNILQQNSLDWITFTSSSTVSNFFKILGQDSSSFKLPNLASIGSITSKTLNSYSLQPVFTADPQNLEGLCRGIVDWEMKQKKLDG